VSETDYISVKSVSVLMGMFMTPWT